MSRKRFVPMQAYLDRILPRDKVATLQEARAVYVTYGVLLCEAGVYSTAAIAASIAKALWARRAAAPLVTCGTIAIYDTSGASGLQTLSSCRTNAPRLDISPAAVLAHVTPRRRVDALGALVTAIPWPRTFFEHLFELYAQLAVQMVHESQAAAVVAANERSLGCAPFLAATKFRCNRPVQLVQHGNPSCDYLPTLADTYFCRSDRWFQYLRQSGLVGQVERISDFPALTFLRFDPAAKAVALVLHNIGYLEPEVDYSLLTQRITSLCAGAGCRLFVLPHPASLEHFGLPTIGRNSTFAAQLLVGYRSTAADQVDAEMPRVSLLDDWPEFFLMQPSLGRVESFLERIAAALTK